MLWFHFKSSLWMCLNAFNWSERLWHTGKNPANIHESYILFISISNDLKIHFSLWWKTGFRLANQCNCSKQTNKKRKRKLLLFSIELAKLNCVTNTQVELYHQHVRWIGSPTCKLTKSVFFIASFYGVTFLLKIIFSHTIYPDYCSLPYTPPPSLLLSGSNTMI